METPWTQVEAVELCRLVEGIAPKFGCHVGLTGGLLYKDGPRKDADLLIYRIRQTQIDEPALFEALHLEAGLVVTRDHGFVKKALWRGKPLDLLFPEAPDWEAPASGRYGLQEIV